MNRKVNLLTRSVSIRTMCKLQVLKVLSFGLDMSANDFTTIHFLIKIYLHSKTISDYTSPLSATAVTETT